MATRTKANNTDALNLTTSWAEGAVPTSSDDVTWNVNQTAAIGAAISMRSLTFGSSAGGGISASTTNALTIGAGAAIDCSGLSAAITIACPVVLTVATSISVNTAQTLTISGSITGTTYTLAKEGNGILILSGSANNHNNVTINAGTIKIQGGLPMAYWSRTWTIVSGAVLDINGNCDIALNTTTINGAGTLRISSGKWENTTATGRYLTIAMSAGGLIDIQATCQLTNGGWQAITWTNNLATLNVDGTFNVWDGNNVFCGALTGSGIIDKTSYGAFTRTLTIGNDNGSGTFNGVIGPNSTGVIAITKAGTGVQTFATGTNSYTGATTVSGGTLLINSSLASGSAVTVANGATIGGTGTINGTLTMSAGSTLQPTVSGANGGTLTYANATAISIASTITYKVRAPSSTIDRLTNSSATPTFTATNANLVIDVTGLASSVYTATIVSTAKTPNGVVGTFNSVAVTGGNFTAAVTYNTDSITITLIAALLLRKPIEVGTVTFATSDTTKTVTLATALTTDTTKTILLFNDRSNSTTSTNYNVLGKVLSTTQIQFERSGTPDTAATVEYQVIEFLQGITVQHLSFAQSSATVDTTITSIDTTKTFPIISAKGVDTGFSRTTCISAEITTATNLQTVIVAGTAMEVGVQIVQIDVATVQKVTTAMNAGALAADATVSAITENKTFCFLSMTCSNTGNAGGNHYPAFSYVNTTTFRYTRGYQWEENWNIILYVVSLSAGVTTQNIYSTIAANTTSISPTISAVNVSNTALTINGLYQRMVGNDGSVTSDGGFICMTLSGLTNTAFTATRGTNNATASFNNVQVLEFVSLSYTRVILIQEFL
jgi:autotransporter-associated beta strand protein